MIVESSSSVIKTVHLRPEDQAVHQSTWLKTENLTSEVLYHLTQGKICSFNCITKPRYHWPTVINVSSHLFLYFLISPLLKCQIGSENTNSWNCFALTFVAFLKKVKANFAEWNFLQISVSQLKKKVLWKQILVCRNDLSPQITHCWKVDVWFEGDALWHSTFGMRFLRPCREALLPRACCATGAAGSHSSSRQARLDRHAEKGKEMAGSGAPGCWHARPSVSQSAQRLSDWPH